MLNVELFLLPHTHCTVNSTIFNNTVNTSSPYCLPSWLGAKEAYWVFLHQQDLLGTRRCSFVVAQMHVCSVNASLSLCMFGEFNQNVQQQTLVVVFPASIRLLLRGDWRSLLLSSLLHPITLHLCGRNCHKFVRKEILSSLFGLTDAS